VVVQGNVIGNQDFIRSLIQQIAAELKLQGVAA
jgi:hypothetical protein